MHPWLLPHLAVSLYYFSAKFKQWSHLISESVKQIFCVNASSSSCSSTVWPPNWADKNFPEILHFLYVIVFCSGRNSFFSSWALLQSGSRIKELEFNYLVLPYIKITKIWRMETNNRSLLFCATLCICLALGTSHFKQRCIPVKMPFY